MLTAYNALLEIRNYETVLGRRGVLNKNMTENHTFSTPIQLIINTVTFQPCQRDFLFVIILINGQIN